MATKKRYTPLEYLLRYIKPIFKWTLLAILIGIACGFVGVAFYYGIAYATDFRTAHPWVLYLLPVIGLVIVAIYRLSKVEGEGTDDIITSVQEGKVLHLLLLPAIFISTILTHLGGGSAGREGAALQIGGEIGNHMGQLARLDHEDLKITTMAGMAAFFSAVFGTPLTATIFVVMFINVGYLYEMAVFPCFIASLSAYWISMELGVQGFRYPLALPAEQPLFMLRLVVLAALCGLMSSVMCNTFHYTGKLFAKLKNPYLRAFIGGGIIVAATLILGNTDYNGAGSNIIRLAVEEGVVVPYAFLLKLLFTAVTLQSGFKGGEIVPTFFIGATFGAVVGPLLGVPVRFAAAVGMIALFGSATNTLIAPIFLAIEAFGGMGVHFFALAAAVAYICSGYTGLYSKQKIMFSKVRAAARVDRLANQNEKIRQVSPEAYMRLLRQKRQQRLSESQKAERRTKRRK